MEKGDCHAVPFSEPVSQYKEKCKMEMMEKEVKVNAILKENHNDYRVRFTEEKGAEVCDIMPLTEGNKSALRLITGDGRTISNLSAEEIAATIMDAAKREGGLKEEILSIATKGELLKRLLPLLSRGDLKAEYEERNYITGDFLDMTVSFYIPLKGDQERYVSCPLTRDLAKRYDVSYEEAYKAAAENIEAQMSYRTMKAVLCELSGMDPEEAGIFDSPLSVLTNKENYRGAATLVSEGIRTHILSASEGYDHVLILPSSIHECLIVEPSMDMSGEELKGMVQSVNSTEVEEKDRLSDSVYILDRDGLRIYA